MRELTTALPEATHAWLDIEAEASDRSKAEIVHAILEHWAQQKAKAFRVTAHSLNGSAAHD